MIKTMSIRNADQRSRHEKTDPSPSSPVPPTQGEGGVAAPPAPKHPPLTVENSDPKLFAFLERQSTDPTAAIALSEWLADRSDPRAEAVRELAEVRCVIPEGVPDRVIGRPMACGRWWCAYRFRHRVTATVYPGTPLALLLSSAQARHDVEVQLPRRRQTSTHRIAAFEECRQTLLLRLFDVHPDRFSHRQAVFFEPQMFWVRLAFAVCESKAVPWMLELRKINPDRYERSLKHIWSRPDLHWIGMSVITADSESTPSATAPDDA